jgi:solute:Na+ symporter, SSS family
MPGLETFPLGLWDYVVFVSYFIVLSAVGLWAGRKKKADSEDYFLAGRTLPWYVVGTSFVGANISSEHFIGMIGAAYVFGICVALSEWSNVWVFSLLIWFFIPFLLLSRIVTMPEFLERRFGPVVRQFFAIMTLISNVVAFLAAVLYGGGLALQALFGWNLWVCVIVLGLLAGIWSIYGGLKAVAYVEFFMVGVMLGGGLLVTVLGLYSLSGDAHSLLAGWRKMIVLNQAGSGVWKEAVARTAPYIAHVNDYNRLSVIQPITHLVTPWPHILVGFLSISLWYNVGNQFMIQRVLGAKDIYHARMGIVLAGFLKIVLPLVIVVPGLILFALHPQAMLLPWKDIRPAADKGYVTMLQTLIPIGFRGLFLAALFGAIQSSLNAVINSTATIFTIDIYKRLLRPAASERHYVRVGVASSVVVTIIGILLAPGVSQMGHGLFVYIHTLFAFFAPPFASVFLLGILFRRINTPAATVTLFLGFAFAILVKLFVQYVPSHPAWIEPFAMQAFVVWVFCTLTCVTVSLLTPPPAPEKITDQLTFNWRTLNITQNLGGPWYQNVVFWWLIFVTIVLALGVLFSGLFI